MESLCRGALLLSILMAAMHAFADEPLPTVGAIRWDGWFEDNPWEKNLVSEEWHYRLPFFATTSEDGKVRVCGDSQEAMDREIQYADAGGIDYWAFCYYHPKSWPQADSYNYGWKRYLASERKKDLNFCFLLQSGDHLGPKDEWNQTVEQFVGIFKEPTYQRVCGDRPLLYVFSCENLIKHFGSADAARDAFNLLREETKKAGLGDPYIVAQIWMNQVNGDFLDAVRFDALGAYSAQAGEGGALSHAKLIETNRSYWEAYKRTGREVVPTVNAGWDGRPRNYEGPWYAHATPAEIADSLRQAFDWIRDNPGVAPARTVLFYAWNEHDEGGWLCPTLDEGSARLDAIRALKK